jgi:D-arabinose 1-dehydrogenase-like Zn-dependent alcohol dehydrogenase
VAFDLDSYVRLLNPQGQLCLVASPLKPLLLSGGLLNNSRRSIYGNYIGSRADTTRMLEFSAKHGIEAIVEVMPFALTVRGPQVRLAWYRPLTGSHCTSRHVPAPSRSH